MGISYNKLFKLLIDRKMKKKDLQELAGLSATTVSKLGKNEFVSMDVIVKICDALKVDVGEISQDADNEGITFDDGKKVAERAVDDIMALLPGGTICFLGFVGRMCYGSGSADAVRIDYEKYANGEENYLINSQ